MSKLYDKRNQALNRSTFIITALTRETRSSGFPARSDTNRAVQSKIET